MFKSRKSKRIFAGIIAGIIVLAMVIGVIFAGLY